MNWKAHVVVGVPVGLATFLLIYRFLRLNYHSELLFLLIATVYVSIYGSLAPDYDLHPAKPVVAFMLPPLSLLLYLVVRGLARVSRKFRHRGVLHSVAGPFLSLLLHLLVLLPFLALLRFFWIHGYKTTLLLVKEGYEGGVTLLPSFFACYYSHIALDKLPRKFRRGRTGKTP